MTPSPPAVTPSSGVEATGGCGGTPVRDKPPPGWAASANPPDLPLVTANEGNLIGSLFAGRLRAGHPENPSNKILWIVREPRQGASLRLTLRPVQGTAPEVALTRPADSGPGEIYPSIVDVPAPGCWRVTAEWNGNRATLDLLYH
jgi:hypothetical protein